MEKISNEYENLCEYGYDITMRIIESVEWVLRIKTNDFREFFQKNYGLSQKGKGDYMWFIYPCLTAEDKWMVRMLENSILPPK